jgi:hypothetical protein
MRGTRVRGPSHDGYALIDDWEESNPCNGKQVAASFRQMMSYARQGPSLLRDSPAAYQASCFPFRRSSSTWLAERCSAAKVRFAAAKPARLDTCAPFRTADDVATGGGN